MTPGTIRERVLAVLLGGLPWTDRPYADVAEQIGVSESEVLQAVQDLIASDTLSRMGFVVRHHEAGYRANAMVVWALTESDADRYGERLTQEPAVTLCYRRRASPPDWPYNLYAMVHGKDRGQVGAQVEQITVRAGLAGVPRKVLFSTRRFMQRSGLYLPSQQTEAA